MATQIGTIGAGNVGNALARGLRRAGHDVRVVGKDPGATREAVSWAEIVLLAARAGVRDAGPLKSARQLEPLAFFNIQLGYVLGMGTQIGFKLLHG